MNAILTPSPSDLMATDTPSGIPVCGNLAWGTHFCHLYETRQDLIDTLVPYFMAGLANNEKCIWITSEPLFADDAKEVLTCHVQDLQTYLDRKQIQIADHSEWYTHLTNDDTTTVLQGWLDAEQSALAEGYAGLRVTGNISFAKTLAEWETFQQYDAQVSNTIGGRRVLGLCSFHLGQADAADVFDVIQNHEFAIARRAGSWNVIENARITQAKQQLSEANMLLEQSVATRTAELENALLQVQMQKRELELALQAQATTQKRLEVELEDARLVHSISSALINQGALDDLYQKLVDVAAFVMRSDYATLQKLDEQQNALFIIANHNFNAEALDYWGCVPAARPTSCGIALQRKERCIVNDYETWELAADSEDLLAFRAGGVRAAQSTPLLTRSGNLVGMISTHWKHTHTPSDRDLRMLDVIARQAADLIERTSSSEALKDKAQQLEEADKRKDLFLATLAHELRNPLAPIKTGLSVLQLGATNTPQIVNMMERQVSHMVRLIDELIDVSRVSRGLISLKRAPFDLAIAIDSAIETSRPLLEAAHHAFTFTSCDEPIWLNADITRIAQILSNVLNNAAKYTPDGGVIELSVESSTGFAKIRVTDNGIGVSEEMLAKIFESFTRADDAAVRNSGGLGLGLSLAKQLTELHGGSISAESRGPGHGTTFTVLLPRCAAPANAVEAQVEATQPAQRSARVLVVDDNADAAETLGLLLEALGYQPRVVTDSRLAVDAALAFGPDVVFLDLGMPHLNGFELAQLLRQQTTLSTTPLVALSGWGTSEDRQRTKDAGFGHHLTKPVMMADVQNLLENITPKS